MLSSSFWKNDEKFPRNFKFQVSHNICICLRDSRFPHVIVQSTWHGIIRLWNWRTVWEVGWLDGEDEFLSLTLCVWFQVENLNEWNSYITKPYNHVANEHYIHVNNALQWASRRRWTSSIWILTDYAQFPCWFEKQTSHDGILSTTHYKFTIVFNSGWKA